MKQLKTYINLNEAQRVGVELEGIPLDSVDNELVKWVKVYGETFRGSNIAVRGDGNTPYPALKNLFDEFGKADLNKFQLITKTENKE